MSVKLISELWKKQVGGKAEHLLLIALAWHVNEKREDARCWPGVQRLAAMIGCSPRYTKTMLAAFRKNGVVIRVENESGGQGSRAVLKLDLDKLSIKGDAQVTLSRKNGDARRTRTVIPSAVKGDLERIRNKEESERIVRSNRNLHDAPDVAREEVGEDSLTQHDKQQKSFSSPSKSKTYRKLAMTQIERLHGFFYEQLGEPRYEITAGHRKVGQRAFEDAECCVLHELRDAKLS